MVASAICGHREVLPERGHQEQERGGMEECRGLAVLQSMLRSRQQPRTPSSNYLEPSEIRGRFLRVLMARILLHLGLFCSPLAMETTI